MASISLQISSSSLLSKRSKRLHFPPTEPPSDRQGPLSTGLTTFMTKLTTLPPSIPCRWRSCPKAPDIKHTHLYPFDVPTFSTFLQFHRSPIKQACSWRGCESVNPHTHTHSPASRRMIRYHESIAQDCLDSMYALADAGSKKSVEDKREEVDYAINYEKSFYGLNPYEDEAMWREEFRTTEEMAREDAFEAPEARTEETLEEAKKTHPPLPRRKRAVTRSQLIAQGDNTASVAVTPRNRRKSQK